MKVTLNLNITFFHILTSNSKSKMAEALIKDLSGQVQSNDIESGKKTLTKLKVMANILYCYMIHTHLILML